MSDKDYEVGYGKPPKRTQFKPGQSGNPKGRPKGARSPITILRELMEEKFPLTSKKGKTKWVPYIEAVGLASRPSGATGSMKGLLDSMKLVREYTELTQKSAANPLLDPDVPITFTLKLEDDDPDDEPVAA